MALASSSLNVGMGNPVFVRPSSILRVLASIEPDGSGLDSTVFYNSNLGKAFRPKLLLTYCSFGNT